MGRKRRIEQDELVALATERLSDGTFRTHKMMAEKLDVTTSAVTKALKKVPPALLDSRDVMEFRRNRADAFAELQRQILMYISPDKLKKASLSQLGTLLGIMYDKEALEQGRATSHVAVVSQQKMDPATVKLLKDAIKANAQAKLASVQRPESQNSGDSESDDE